MAVELWIRTVKGLARFYRVRLMVFSAITRGGLPDEHVTALLVDRAGLFGPCS